MGAGVWPVMYAFGYRPSPRDVRGTRPLCRVSPVPQSCDNSSLIVDVLNQGGEGSCVGCSIAQAIRGALIHEGSDRVVLPSAQWIYWLGRSELGDQDRDVGTTPSAALEGLRAMGIAEHDNWPYEAGDIQPGDRLWSVARAAADQSYLSGYSRVSSSGQALVSDVRAALAAGHLVIGGTFVDDVFCNLGPSDVWRGVSGEIVGGHCVCLVDYDGPTIRGVNSWGDTWCRSGFFSLDVSALDGFSDLWIVSSSPRFSGTV